MQIKEIMDSGGIFFYVVVAVSVGGAILKAFRKKTETEQDVPSKGEIFRKLLEEIQQVDDYIPSNPNTPKAAPASSKTVHHPGNPMEVAKTSSGSARKNVEEAYSIPEYENMNSKRSTSYKSVEMDDSISNEKESTFEYDLSDPDEFKKAVVYSEILKTKF
jgi:hypothetical protein